MKSGLKTLEHRISETTGRDPELDGMIAATLDVAAGDYTSSVDTCLSLIGSVLPEWHWHVGHGPTGILPYASLTKATGSDSASELRVEATAANDVTTRTNPAACALCLRSSPDACDPLRISQERRSRSHPEIERTGACRRVQRSDSLRA